MSGPRARHKARGQHHLRRLLPRFCLSVPSERLLERRKINASNEAPASLAVEPDEAFNPVHICPHGADAIEIIIMRIALIVVGVLLTFFGAVWFFQGINVLPGSFMTGQTQWAVYGGIAFVVGVFVIYFARRMPRSSQT